MTCAYYNEHDKFAAAWLRELMLDGLIAPGDVDERSILDVTPGDLSGYRQCHFFAGIGIWSLALRQAGWADDRPIWTGSCPCQPFSAAGKGGGFADERHLWPAFHWLIDECGPAIVVGEQVSSDDGLAWIDLVLADLDQSGYACGALDTCAAGFGAPHIRQRLYWLAYAGSGRLEAVEQHGAMVRARDGEGPGGDSPTRAFERGGVTGRLVNPTRGGRRECGDAARAGHRGPDGSGDAACGMADAGRAEWRPRDAGRDDSYGQATGRQEGASGPAQRGELSRLADSDRLEPSANLSYADSESDGRRHLAGDSAVERLADPVCDATRQHARELSSDESEHDVGAENGDHGLGDRGATRRPGPTNGRWALTDWLGCRDGKWRPVESGTFPLAPSGTVRNRVGTLRGAGNALNLAQAQAFIELIA